MQLPDVHNPVHVVKQSTTSQQKGAGNNNISMCEANVPGTATSMATLAEDESLLAYSAVYGFFRTAVMCMRSSKTFNYAPVFIILLPNSSRTNNWYWELNGKQDLSLGRSEGGEVVWDARTSRHLCGVLLNGWHGSVFSQSADGKQLSGKPCYQSPPAGMTEKMQGMYVEKKCLMH